MKNIILVIITISIICSCKKEKVSYKLSGQLSSCFANVKRAYANEEIRLYQKNPGFFSNDDKALATTKTDNNGNFSFDYFAENTNNKVAIQASSGFGFNTLVSQIPVKNIDNADFYLGGYNLVVSLNVTKPYTNSDTLYVSNLKTLIFVKKAGPFVSGRYYVETNVPVKPEVNYEFNSEDLRYVINDNSNTFYTDFKIENNKLCGDTVYVTLDIK